MDYSPKLIKLILPTLFLIVSFKATATTATGSLSASALVTTNCSLTSANLNFGSYDPIEANFSAALNSTAAFQIACTKGSNVTISLNSGLYAQFATQTTRAMSNGNNSYLSYELYSNPGHTIVWSNTNPVRFTSTTFAPLSETIYGSIPPGQNIKAGDFTDTVTITATF